MHSYISQKCVSQLRIIYTPTCFDIFMSSSGSLHVRLAKLTQVFQIAAVENTIS